MPDTTEHKYLAFKPDWMTKKAWCEIIDSWENGLSDREASFRASRFGSFKITEAELKRLVEENPEIASLREFLQTALVSQAKLNIAGSINEGNVSTAKWLLERKAPEEYSSKAAVAFEGAVTALSIEDKMAEMDEFMSQFKVENKDDNENLLPEGVGDGRE